VIFLSHRLYRQNQRPQTRAWQMRVSRNPMHENSFTQVDSSECHSPLDPPSPIGRQRSWGKRPLYHADLLYMESGFPTRSPTEQQSDVGDPPSRRIKHPYLAGTNSGFPTNYRDRDDTLGRQAYGQEPRPPPYDKDPTTVNRSLAKTQPRTYIPFPKRRRPPQTPPSPSIYSTTLPVAEDDNSVHQLPTPTSIACLKSPAVPNKIYDPGESSKRVSSDRVLVDPGTYMMTPLELEDDEGYTAVSLIKPPSDGPCELCPPPVPPKSPLRRVVSMGTMLDVSFSPPPIFVIRTKVDNPFAVTGSRHRQQSRMMYTYSP
jgi:hypothetical protein